jgi:hypothetical protein
MSVQCSPQAKFKQRRRGVEPVATSKPFQSPHSHIKDKKWLVGPVCLMYGRTLRAQNNGRPSAIFRALQPDGRSNHFLVGHYVRAKLARLYSYQHGLGTLTTDCLIVYLTFSSRKPPRVRVLLCFSLLVVDRSVASYMQQLGKYYGSKCNPARAAVVKLRLWCRCVASLYNPPHYTQAC